MSQLIGDSLYISGSPSIQALYGTYNSKAAGVSAVQTGVYKNVPKGVRFGVVLENGYEEYMYVGPVVAKANVSADDFIRTFPPIPEDFIQVMEPGIYNIDANYTVEPSGSVVVGTGGSSSDSSSLAQDVERIKAILGDLYSSEGDSHFEITQ